MEPPEIEPAIEDPMQEAGVPKNPPPRQDHCRRQEAAADAARHCRRQDAAADASDDEEEEEDEEDKIPRAEVPVVDKPFDRPVPKPAPQEAFLLSIVLAARSSA